MTAAAGPPGVPGEGLPAVLAEFGALDALLRDRVARFRVGSGPEQDGLTAYYVPDAEVDALLAAPNAAAGPDRPTLHRMRAAGPPAGSSRLDALARAFGLTPTDVDAVLICLALEVDRRYERLYGYLQDDVTRRSPTVDLILDLSCGDPRARLAGRARFAPSAPLLRHRLVSLEDDPGRRSCSLLERSVQLSARITRYLLSSDTGDDRDDDVDDPLLGIARVVIPGPAAADLDPRIAAQLRRLAGPAAGAVVVHCRAADGAGQAIAEAFCLARGGVLLAVRAGRLAAEPAEHFTTLLELLGREVRLHDAILYWDDAGPVPADDRGAHAGILDDFLAALVRDRRVPVFVAGSADWRPGATAGVDVVPLDVPPPDLDARVRLWRAAIDPAAGPTAGPDVDRLAATFRFGPRQIAAAAATARTLAAARDRPEEPAAGPTDDDLFAAARLHSNRALGRLAERVVPRHGWDDIVLPADRIEQLREIADQVRHRALVHERWGFASKVTSAPGINALFTGPPGTGKTMAASVLARALDVDLYKIDLSSMVSKYIGETEKNLARVFDEAATSNAILFFDEADALFGKRTQVRDAHDRYANLETSYLLQKLESHAGVVVLSTNLRKNMDDAFVRRLHVTVEFPVPGVAERLRIWQRIWPDSAPRHEDIDLDLLARQIHLPGGHIRNIVLAGAFLAAADGGCVTMAHVVQATRREYQKLGMVLTAGEFGTGESGTVAAPRGPARDGSRDASEDAAVPRSR